MGKLTNSEHMRYREAEDHLRREFPMCECMWEVAKPAGTRYAMLAGFIISHGALPRLVILQINNGGTGWDIYGAPTANAIGDTFAGLKRMWEG